MKLPLYVLDRKSKGGGFVIQSLEDAEKRTDSPKKAGRDARQLDYRSMGLLWDRPSMSNKQFQAALKNPSSEDHLWVAQRFLERVSSLKVKDVLALPEIKAILSKVKLRHVFQEAWTRAVHYWSENLNDILPNKIMNLITKNELEDYLDLFRLIPASCLTMKEVLELALAKETGLDPLIIANQMEFVFKSQPPSKELLGTADWNDLQLFFRKFQKECLDLARP